MKSKKIALLFSGDFPEGNTKNARLKIIATELKKHDWDAAFYSAVPHRFSKGLLDEQPKEWNGYKIKYFSIYRKYPSHFIIRIGQFALAHFNLICWSLSNANKYNAIYYYNPRWTDTLFSLCLNKLLGRVVIVDQTELFSTEKNRIIHNTEEKIIAKYASVLLVISNKLRSHFSELRQKETYLLPILINTDRFDKQITEKKFLMGYIGSFASKDGIDLLLEATKLLLPQYPALTLRLVGHNPQMRVLEEEVIAMGLENIVEITGTVSYDAIPRLLLECDTLLMNRDASIFSTYGYPIKLGEYFACKKPVIMSDGEGFAEDFEHRNQVYKYKLDDAQSLAETINYRYQNIGESDAVAIRGFQHAKDYFCGEKMVRFLHEILEKTCSK